MRFALERRVFEGAQLESVPPLSLPGRTVHFLEALSFMAAEEQRLRELVVTLLGAAHVAGNELVLWIHGDSAGIRLRYGVVEPEGGVAPTFLRANLERMLHGAFPGVTLRSLARTDPSLKGDLQSFVESGACALIVGIPSERVETPVESRLDDVLNGLAGRAFDVLLHCAPVRTAELDVAETNLAHVVNVVHEIAQQQLSASDSESFSDSVARGINQSWSTSETTNWSTSDSTSTTRQTAGHHARGIGVAAGAVVGGLIGAVVGAPSGPGAAVTAAAGAKVGAVIGGVAGGGLLSAIFPPVQETVGTSITSGVSRASQTGGGTSETVQEAYARQLGRTVSIERVNRQAAILEELAGLHLRRLRQMQSFGGWHCAIHLAAGDSADLHLVGSLLIGALRGDQTHLENLRLVPVAPHAAHNALTHAAACRPTRVAAVPHALVPRGEQALTLLSSEELALWFRPPSSSIVGVDVRPTVSFNASTGPHRARRTENGGAPRVHLGTLIAGGNAIPGIPVGLDADDLARHCFVAGTTGSGKTTTLRQILRQLAGSNVPFLVVEPAKTEYRGLFEELRSAGHRPLRLSLAGGDSEDHRALRFNPWRAPAGVPLGRHLEGMKILLRSCFAMQESLPQVLERLVFEVVRQAGWLDLMAPVPDAPSQAFPTFADFVAPGEAGARSLLERVVDELGYGKEPRANITAAMRVRLESFTRGVKGSVFGAKESDFDELLHRPTFIELTDLNEPDIKRFLIGALVLRLSSEREARARRQPSGRPLLEHVLVLEEAHHFLREAAGMGPASELIRETNLLLADAFAELRAHGQGIIVADQAPAELSPAVLRNTNTKIVHRLLFEKDCAAVGDAMGLDDEQQLKLRHLSAGEAVVTTSRMVRPVLCRIDNGESHD